MVDGFFPFDILRVQNHNNDIDIVSVAQIEIVGEREHTLEMSRLQFTYLSSGKSAINGAHFVMWLINYVLLSFGQHLLH